MKIGELEKLRDALDAIDGLPPLAQASELAHLTEEAKLVVGAVSRQCAAVLAELTAPGAEYYRRIPELAAELGVARGRIDEALAAHRLAKRSEGLSPDPLARQQQILARLREESRRPSGKLVHDVNKVSEGWL